MGMYSIFRMRMKGQESMQSQSFLSRLQGLPMPILPAMLGFATLSNVWAGAGYHWVGHIAMSIAAFVWLLYMVKIFFHGRVCAKEYAGTVPSSLYSAFFMLAMSLSAWFSEWLYAPARMIYIAAVALHAIHIVVFTIRHVLRGIQVETFMPTWFVTYVGITVSTVVGGVFDFPVFPTFLVYYGLIIYAVLTFFLILRLQKHPVPGATMHSRAIMMAPCSLLLVSYLNVIQNPNPYVVGVLYALIFIMLIYALGKIPLFFSVAFHPGFASLTFPMAIATVASFRVADYLLHQGHVGPAAAITQFAGIQMYLSTAVIGFVVFNFARMGVKSLKSPS